MPLMVRANFPDLMLTEMLPALDELIFSKFDPYPPQFSKVFRVLDSGRSFEQTTEISGLGMPQKTPEGKPVTYDQPVQGFDKTYLHEQYSNGFMASRIMVDDDKFGIVKKMATDLGKGSRELLEIRVASHFNNGFSGSYLGPDGKSLFATDHPLVKAGGSQANKLAIAADLDIVSLQLLLTLMRKSKDHSGKKQRVKPAQLLIPADLEFVAPEILAGAMRGDTANNTVNAFQHREGFSSFNKWMVWDYLDDPDAWFVTAEKQDTELRFYWRERPNTLHDVDFDTRSVKTAIWFRWSSGWSSYEGVAGSEGA